MTETDLKIYLKKAAYFCVYQERTQKEVRERLAEWDIIGDDAEEIIAYLISENYVNEERFAKIFAGSKFRVKHWGRQKIRYELKMRGLSAYCVDAGMREIEDEDYLDALKILLEKKKHELRGENILIRNQKIARFALSKGFESELVWDIIKKM
jgi:regulatory protein